MSKGEGAHFGPRLYSRRFGYRSRWRPHATSLGRLLLWARDSARARRFLAESRLDPRERITVVQVEFGRSTMVQRALVMGLPAGYGRAPFSHARNSRSEQRMTSRVLTLGSSGSGRRTIPMLSLEHKNGCAMPTGRLLR